MDHLDLFCRPVYDLDVEYQRLLDHRVFLLQNPERWHQTRSEEHQQQSLPHVCHTPGCLCGF